MVKSHTRNNVAALTQRHSSPARGWPRGMLRIRTSNEWPYGQWRQDCRRYSGWYHVSGDTVHLHRLNIPRGGRQIAAPTAMYNDFGFLKTQNVDRCVKYTVFVTNVSSGRQSAARHVAIIICDDEWYYPIYGTKCSGVDPTPSSPARGWPRGMLQTRTANEWPYGQWRQIAAATVGGTMFRVIPFTPTC